MYPIQQNVALSVPFFAHDSDGNAVTTKADGDWTKRISKGGGAFAAMEVTVTEMEGGWYELAMTADHTDTLGILTVYLTTAQDALQVNMQWRVNSNSVDNVSASVDELNRAQTIGGSSSP